MIRLCAVPVSDLTAKQYKQCYDLNLRSNGMMQYTLQCLRTHDSDNAFAIMAIENDVLLGWCLLDSSAKDYTAMFYVRESHRRQGIGTRLIKMAHKLNGPLMTGTSYKSGSEEFFEKHNALLKKR